MLELTEAERRALQVVVLRCEVKASQYGAAHQKNWKKTGLSRAFFQKERVCEGSMPTPRAAAAFRFLMAHNKYYAAFHAMQGSLLPLCMRMTSRAFYKRFAICVVVLYCRRI